MRYAHLTNLIHQAATVIEEDAECLRACHSFDGKWIIEDPADEHARAAYERDVQLVADLREAHAEFSACHESCLALEQMLRAYRDEGAPINYTDLAALLPEKTA